MGYRDVWDVLQRVSAGHRGERTGVIRSRDAARDAIGRLGPPLVRVIIVGLIFITALPLFVARLTLCTPVQAVWGHIPGQCGNTRIPLYLGWASGGECILSPGIHRQH